MVPRVSAWVQKEEEVDRRWPAPNPLPAPAEKACPPGRKAQVLDENLVFYEEWELEACVDGALLAAQMDQVNLVPFTYQQLHILKRKLDEVVQDSRLPAVAQFSQLPGEWRRPSQSLHPEVLPTGVP